jgi:hypothetical protein
MPSLDGLEYGCIVALARVPDVRLSVRSKWFYKAKRGETKHAVHGA